MQNIELLFEKNHNQISKGIRKKIRYNPQMHRLEYYMNTKIFCGDDILDIISVINFVNDVYRGQKLPIAFICKNFEFSDKLVYIILECICQFLLIDKRQQIYFVCDAKTTIWSEGINFSPLKYLNDRELFQKFFMNDLQARHFRKVISAEAKDDGADLSKLMQEIECFLINNGVSEKGSEELSEVLAELVGNSREHAKTDTLIDIDITNTTYKKKNDENIYYGMNTAIINFSPRLFFEPLKEKIESGIDLPDKYQYVKKAYEYHREYFGEAYEENDFYTLSSFQDKISGSMSKTMGGRGLTTLISSLEEQADTHLCYMLSGNTVFFLLKEYLCYDDNRLIGFNKNADYLTEIPDKQILKKIATFMPGTSYNLSFAIRKEWSLE